jgi:hypothetical protein
VWTIIGQTALDAPRVTLHPGVKYASTEPMWIHNLEWLAAHYSLSESAAR